VPLAWPEHVEQAIAAAVKSFAVTRKLAAYERQSALAMIASELVERNEEQRAHIYSASRPREWTQQQLAGDLLQRAFGGSAKSLMLRLDDGPVAVRVAS